MDTVAYTYGDTTWGDLMTTYDGNWIHYDGVGNPDTDGTWDYTWRNGRELASMTDGSTTWTFTYNADGIRTKKTNGTTVYKYTYNGSTLTQLDVATNRLFFVYDGTSPTAVVFNNTTYYYVTNLQGDIIAILNGSGTKVVEYTYDAWGNILSTTGTLASTLGVLNPLRYRGYVYDSETGLYYVSSRYYDPEIGRWINADDTAYLGADGTPLSYNLFAYCKNNPVMGYDPTGHFLISTAVLIGAIVGGVIGGTVGGVSTYTVAKSNGAEGWELAGWTALGIVGGGAVGAAVGAAVGYGVGYLAGGTYANGLAAKSVESGVKAFASQANKVHHVLSKAGHNLSGYTAKAMKKLMRKTLTNGVVGPYKSVQSAYWATMNSEVTFTIVNGILKISDMWIR